jgi:hypothetical protein
MALVTIAQAGFASKKSSDMQKAGELARSEGEMLSDKNNSDLLESGYKKRREGQGTILGGENSASSVSKQGTVLTQTQQKPSLLG